MMIYVRNASQTALIVNMTCASNAWKAFTSITSESASRNAETTTSRMTVKTSSSATNAQEVAKLANQNHYATHAMWDTS